MSTKQILDEDLIDYFASLTRPDSIDVGFSEEDIENIEQYMYELEIPRLEELWSRRHTRK